MIRFIKKKAKSIVCIVLAAVTLFTMNPAVFAKETDTHPVKENEKAKEKARYLGKRLNELCNRK